MEDKTDIFDALAGEIYEVSSSLFSPTPHHDGAQTTFTVTEMVIMCKSQSKTLCEDRVVCTEAQFYDSVVIRPETFGLRCYCTSRLHEVDLGYQLIPGKSLLKEEMGCDRLRKWSVLVFKPKTSEHAIVRLMALSPINIRKIERISASIAMLSFESYASFPDIPPEHRQGRTVDSRAIELIRNDWGFPSTKVVKVTCDSGSTQSILTKPRIVEIKHFGVVLTPGEQTDLDDGLPVNICPQSYFSILLYGSSPGDGLEVRVAETTRISHEDNPLGRLVITMKNAMVAPLKSHRQGKSYNDVNFHFDLRRDAETFSSYLRASQVRLREIFTQGPVQDEKVLYFRDFPTPNSSLINENCPEATLRCMVVLTQANERSLQNYRGIVSRGGSTRSVCFNFEDSAIKRQEGGLRKRLEDAIIWIHDYDSNGRSLFSQTTWHELTRRKTRLRSLGVTFITSGIERTAIDWLDEVDDLIRILRGGENDAYDKVKIAVIDSGIHDSQKLQYQAEYKEFTNHPRNDSWHGTSCAGIIQGMYAEAKFYIARIFKNDHADENEGPLQMARAILWAIEPPQSVDIISISAGFPNYSKELDDAVTKAKSIGVLVIAAASNWQNIRSVAFPARHNLSTMCIYSANTGNQGSHFNPEPRDVTPNLAILGEGFQHPDQHRNKPLAGTSMATAVAAGLAAMIIDFSRQKDNKASIFRAQDVGKLSGMLSIFSAISKPAGNLRCIFPLELLPLENGLSREAKRQRVREVLSQAMERAN